MNYQRNSANMQICGLVCVDATDIHYGHRKFLLLSTHEHLGPYANVYCARKCLSFWQKYHQMCSQVPHRLRTSIGSGNKGVPNRRQSITRCFGPCVLVRWSPLSVTEPSSVFLNTCFSLLQEVTMHPVPVTYFALKLSEADTYHDVLRIFYGEILTNNVIDNMLRAQPYKKQRQESVAMGRPRIGGVSDTMTMSRRTPRLDGIVMSPFMLDSPDDSAEPAAEVSACPDCDKNTRTLFTDTSHHSRHQRHRDRRRKEKGKTHPGAGSSHPSSPLQHTEGRLVVVIWAPIFFMEIMITWLLGFVSGNCFSF